MREARLENWLVVNYGDPYTPPELQIPRLHGSVFGHECFQDGESITTSRISGVNGDYILTRNTAYILGEIDPKYEERFPLARARLFNSLNAQK